MDITGSQKINASRQQVFNALLNPTVLKNSIPSCDSAEFVDLPEGRQLKLVVTPNVPMMKGTFTIFVIPEEIVEPSHLALRAEPYNSMGSIKAKCAIDLGEDGNATNLTYNAHAELEGKLAATPEFIVKPLVKNALDQFFKNFEQQVSNVNA